jgi:hypothetical protein
MTLASMTPPPCCALGPVMVWMSSMKRMALGGGEGEGKGGATA